MPKIRPFVVRGCSLRILASSATNAPCKQPNKHVAAILASHGCAHLRKTNKTSFPPRLTRSRGLNSVRPLDKLFGTDFACTRNERVAFIVSNRVRARPAALPPANRKSGKIVQAEPPSMMTKNTHFLCADAFYSRSVPAASTSS